MKNFGNVKNFWLFGVFDGHGVNGHFASAHVKQYLPSKSPTYDNSVANLELVDYVSSKKVSMASTEPKPRSVQDNCTSPRIIWN